MGEHFSGETELSGTDLSFYVDKMKQKEKILYFDEIHLYEDELADHGWTLFLHQSGELHVFVTFFANRDNLLISYTEGDAQRILHPVELLPARGRRSDPHQRHSSVLREGE